MARRPPIEKWAGGHGDFGDFPGGCGGVRQNSASRGGIRGRRVRSLSLRYPVAQEEPAELCLLGVRYQKRPVTFHGEKGQTAPELEADPSGCYGAVRVSAKAGTEAVGDLLDTERCGIPA